jgi:hypothetical protein
MRTTLFIAAFSFLGCATMSPRGASGNAAKSVGYVGCLEADITVANVQSSGGAETWEATCRGQTFICAEHWSDTNMCGQQINTACSPKLPPAAAASAQ